MTLSVTANPVVTAPAHRVLIDLHLADSYPYTLPYTYGGAALQVSTSDEYPPAPLSGLYEQRLLGEPTIRMGQPNDFGDTQRVEEIQFTLSNVDGSLSSFFTSEMRGKLVCVHFYEKSTAEVQQNVFVGTIAAFSGGFRTLSIIAVSLDLGVQATVIPLAHITPDVFPRTDANGGGGGAPIALGSGIGFNVPARYATAQLQPSDPAYFDYVLGTGNLGIDRIWQDGFLLTTNQNPEGDPYYKILPRTYSKNGRFVTAIRFYRRQSALSGTLATLTADVQRVYPDADAGVVAEYDFRTSPFTDKFGGYSWSNGSVSTISTASLVSGFTGNGLGALRFNDTTATLMQRPTDDIGLNEFSFEMWYRPILNSVPGSGLDYVINVGSDPAAGYGWALFIQNHQLKWTIGKNDGTFTTISASTNPTFPLNKWTHIGLTRTAAGVCTMYINGVANGNATVSSVMRYAPNQPTWFGGYVATVGVEPTLYSLLGDVGWLRFSAVARTAREMLHAYYVGRRSPVEFLREVLEHEVGQSVDHASFDTAAATMDAYLPGGVCCDGWITQDTIVADVLRELFAFRGLRAVRQSDGSWGARLNAAATTVALQVGINDGYDNVVEYAERTRASVAEAIASASLQYRQRRTTLGSLDGYAAIANVVVGSIGVPAKPVASSLIWDTPTADFCVDYRARSLRARDEGLGLRLGIEARRIVPGDIIRVTVPAESI